MAITHFILLFSSCIVGHLADPQFLPSSKPIELNETGVLHYCEGNLSRNNIPVAHLLTFNGALINGREEYLFLIERETGEYFLNVTLLPVYTMDKLLIYVNDILKYKVLNGITNLGTIYLNLDPKYKADIYSGFWSVSTGVTNWKRSDGCVRIKLKYHRTKRAKPPTLRNDTLLRVGEYGEEIFVIPYTTVPLPTTTEIATTGVTEVPDVFDENKYWWIILYAHIPIWVIMSILPFFFCFLGNQVEKRNEKKRASKRGSLGGSSDLKPTSKSKEKPSPPISDTNNSKVAPSGSADPKPPSEG